MHDHDFVNSQFLLQRGLNSWQLNGNYLVAIQYGDVEQCAKLLAQGADADQTFKINSVMRPALCLGVERGAFALGKCFMKYAWKDVNNLLKWSVFLQSSFC